ncbi:SDR family oxidoreductase [Thalassorhabdomicrobium marinisediminis]|uniref:Oxidoreductase n=1 Tax=Thalassorhabdomicrobium marinisediminis TaxID=2170577 RepID=A0A2T7FT14_9RHOB|nr:SDR family oxidoreductase [Thalassorhabdomicrobium marinisediminis]PVA05296.1 oxidoreductase [Thalassorhabdomicrobium marinisediminis]
MTQKILVAGATGKTGRLVVQELQQQGATPIALVRDSSDTSVLPEGTELRYGDLTDLDASVCDRVDAVIFAAGSGSGTDAAMTDKVDREGAQKLTDHAKQAGASRFVMLSSIGAQTPPDEGAMAKYLQAKHDADAHLQKSGMTYAILRPVALSDGPKSGASVFGDAVDPEGEAARSDVAAVLAEAAVKGNLDGQTTRMQSAAT